MRWLKTGIMFFMVSAISGYFWAEAEQELSLAIINPQDKAQMVLIQAGEYTMGSNEWYNDERPPHKVYLNAFYIDKYEVTNAQYKKFVQATAHRIPENSLDPEYDLWEKDGSFPGEIAQQPVVNVSWNDAVAYARWAGKRLPTEAEWEKAARGADQRRYPWGNEPPDKNRAHFAGSWAGEVHTYRAIDSFVNGASPYGIIQMAGNISEWVADWYDPHYYKLSPVKGPIGPNTGTYRVVRGGAFISPAFYLRCTDRDFDIPDDRSNSIGFRCVYDPQ
jgi:sulfatase modifying factor 1